MSGIVEKIDREHQQSEITMNDLRVEMVEKNAMVQYLKDRLGQMELQCENRQFQAEDLQTKLRYDILWPLSHVFLIF
jgi:hypothetical protein